MFIDAGLYPGLPVVSSSSTVSQSSQNDGTSKKDSTKSETKRIESGKPGSKLQESIAKIHSSHKVLKESDKKVDVKKVEKSQTPKSSSGSVCKTSSHKKEKLVKNDDKLDDKAKLTTKEDKQSKLISKPDSDVDKKYDKKEKDIALTLYKLDKRENKDENIETQTKDTDFEKNEDDTEEPKQNDKTEPKETVIKDKRDSPITMTTVSTSSGLSSESPNGHCKPIATTGKLNVQTIKIKLTFYIQLQWAYYFMCCSKRYFYKMKNTSNYNYKEIFISSCVHSLYPSQYLGKKDEVRVARATGVPFINLFSLYMTRGKGITLSRLMVYQQTLY